MKVIAKARVQHHTADADNQPDVHIQVFEGRCSIAQDSNLPGQFHLNEIPPAPCGASQIEVTSSTDVNESLSVSAQNTSTGRSNEIAITNENGRLSQTATDHVIQDAEKYHGGDDSGEDEANKTKIEAQQQHSSKQPTSTQETRRGVEEVEDKEVDEDAMDRTVVTRSTRQRRSQRQGAMSKGKMTSKSIDRAIQIFVKMDGCKTLPLEVSPNDKVGEVVRRIPSSACCSKLDVYRAHRNAFQINSWEPENRIRIMELIEKKGEILNFRKKKKRRIIPSGDFFFE